MMRTFLIPLLVLIVSLVHDAKAEDKPLTADQLHRLCTTNALDAAEGTCNSYFLGLTDGMYLMQELTDIHRSPCMPTEVAIRISDARRLFETYLRSHPQLATNSAGLVAGTAIATAFQCSNDPH